MLFRSGKGEGADAPLAGRAAEEALLAALAAEPLGMEELRELARAHGPAGGELPWLMVWLATAQRDGLVAQYPDGRYGPRLPALEGGRP